MTEQRMVDREEARVDEVSVIKGGDSVSKQSVRLLDIDDAIAAVEHAADGLNMRWDLCESCGGKHRENWTEYQIWVESGAVLRKLERIRIMIEQGTNRPGAGRDNQIRLRDAGHSKE